eukprot:snap_masked-scaffold_41-processed-gene-2.68-mRNA-1 protein AED:1.00 eAED:1.00 QI:0/-1/0/0/-1/1/1/0/218
MNESLDAKLKKLHGIYSDNAFDGYRISREYRKKLKDEKRFQELENLTYGEIDIFAFAELLLVVRDCGLQNFRSFCDIGCGTGKACFVAPLVFESIEKSVGIEIVPPLANTGIEALRTIQQKKVLEKIIFPRKIEFFSGNSFSKDMIDIWSKSDLIFLPTTCFTPQLMDVLNGILISLPKGSVVICTTRKIQLPNLVLSLEKYYKYGKGKLKFLVYIAQ